MSNFWDFMWHIFVVFAFVAYLLILFHIVFDLFRDKSIGGFSKTIWFIALIFLPFLTAVIYVLFRGRGMSDRQINSLRDAQAESDAYIRRVATGKSPAEQIADAKKLLDEGTISADEFNKLKAKIIA